MPNDQFGKPVHVGDPVIIKGVVESVEESPNYVNCTVLLDERMPPSGAEVRVQLNTAQLDDQATGMQQNSGEAAPPRNKPFEPKPTQHEKHESSKK